jgi:hypothetical protein
VDGWPQLPGALQAQPQAVQLQVELAQAGLAIATCLEVDVGLRTDPPARRSRAGRVRRRSAIQEVRRRHGGLISLDVSRIKGKVEPLLAAGLTDRYRLREGTAG